MFDLETQGHTHFSYDLAYLRHYASYWLDLGVDFNIIKDRDLRKSILNNLTLIVDLDFQGQTNFFQICLIFKVNHHSYIICFRFSKFLDLDYVKINTEIKSVACIQPEIMKVIWKYVWPGFSRSTMEVRRHMLVILRFQTSYICSNRHQHCVFITYTTDDEQEVTISNSDLDFQGHPLRSSDKFQ